MNMEMMMTTPPKEPEKQEPNPEFFVGTGFQSMLEVCEEEKKKFNLATAFSEKITKLKPKGGLETVAKGGMSVILQQFMNIPGPSAKDAAAYLYDRMVMNISQLRNKYETFAH